MVNYTTTQKTKKTNQDDINMKDENVNVIIGSGVVGSATGKYLVANKKPTIFHDIKDEKVKKLNDQGYTATQNMQNLEGKQVEAFWICTAEWNVEEAVKQVLPYMQEHTIIVIRSTTKPGETKKLKEKYDIDFMAHNPEFLRAKSAIYDMFHPDRVVVGTGNRFVKKFMVNVYKKNMPNTEVIFTDSTSSEIIKLASNCWLASQISYWNEIKKICEKFDVNPQHVANCCTMDYRISEYGSNMLGSSYGGFCVLPSAKIKKDMTIEEAYDYYQRRYYPKLVVESYTSSFEERNNKNISLVTKRYVDECLYEFETENGKFVCTSEHLMPISRDGEIKIVKAKDIQSDDMLLAKNKNRVRCILCNNVYNKRGFGSHLNHNHNITVKEYYDKYIKVKGEDVCDREDCNNKTSFYDISNGYLNYCSDKCGTKEKWKNQEYRKKVLLNQKKTFSSTEFKNRDKTKYSEAKKGDKNPMKRPEVVEKMCEARKETLQDPDVIKKYSRGTKKAWRDGKFKNVSVGQCKWYDYKYSNGDIYKVQGTWELAFIKWLDDNGLEFKCHKGWIPYRLNGEEKTYYPDFFIYDWDLYIDVKCKHFFKEEKFDMIKKHNPDKNFKILFKKDLISLGVDI